MFIYSEPDGMLINVDDIVFVRSLDEQDLDPRTGELRSGIHADAITELCLRHGGKHYLRESLEDFTQRLRGALDVLEVPR